MAEDFKIPSLKVDEIHKKIISVLHEDARISYTDLAKKVELSRVAVQMRINHLVENGVIERFTAIINPAKVGIHVSAFFNVEVEPKYLESVAQQLEREPAVTSLYHMTGPSKLQCTESLLIIRRWNAFSMRSCMRSSVLSALIAKFSLNAIKAGWA